MPSSSLPQRLVRASALAIVTLALPALLASGCKKKASPTGNPAGSRTNMDARTSMETPATSGTLRFDDFTPTQTTTITRVTWQGIYCAEVLNRVSPPATAEAFEVSFYRDAGNNPDRNTSLQTTVVPIANTAQTLDFTHNGRCGSAEPSGISVYSYSVTLGTPFMAQAGTRYWFSVQARVPYVQANNPDFIFWGWRNGLASNNRSVQVSAAGAMTDFPTDPARLRALEPDETIRREVAALLAALREEAEQQRACSVRASTVADALPDSIGGVRIDALVGSGGSGEVFRGVRTVHDVDHIVAVKRYHLHRSTAGDLERVTREQRLLATLTHPGIVRFFDAGVTSGGRPYLVMELAEGQPITDHADASGLSIRERLRLFLEASRAPARRVGVAVVRRLQPRPHPRGVVRGALAIPAARVAGRHRRAGLGHGNRQSVDTGHHRRGRAAPRHDARGADP